MQMIFNALSGISGQVPVTPIGGNQMHYAQHAFIAQAKQIVALSKKCLCYIMYGTLECCS